MRVVAATIASVALAGPLLAQDGPRVEGYETYVVVAPVTDGLNALPFAELHCAKYNRFPHFRRMDGVKAIFDCEPEKADKKPPARRGTGLY